LLHQDRVNETRLVVHQPLSSDTIPQCLMEMNGLWQLKTG